MWANRRNSAILSCSESLFWQLAPDPPSLMGEEWSGRLWLMTGSDIWDTCRLFLFVGNVKGLLFLRMLCDTTADLKWISYLCLVVLVKHRPGLLEITGLEGRLRPFPTRYFVIWSRGGLSLAGLLCGRGWRGCEGWASSRVEGWAHRCPRLPRTIKPYLCRWVRLLLHRPLLPPCHQKDDSSGGRCRVSCRMWGTGFQCKAADLIWDHFNWWVQSVALRLKRHSDCGISWFDC